MNTLFASFEPTEEVVALLASLRHAGMAWIADEIESTIRNGYSVVRKPQTTRDKNNEHSVMPFNANEQLRITLRVIQRYTVELHKIWHWTQADLRETLENPSLQVSIAYLGGQESIHLFDRDFEMHLTRLDDLLRKAWPGGAESYDFVE